MKSIFDSIRDQANDLVIKIDQPASDVVSFEQFKKIYEKSTTPNPPN